MIVIIKPEEYKEFLQFLADYGFHYKSGQVPGTNTCILEHCHHNDFAEAYTIDIKNREVGYAPYFEIYGKTSSMRDDKKFNYYWQQAVTCSEAKNRILDYTKGVKIR